MLIDQIKTGDRVEITMKEPKSDQINALKSKVEAIVDANRVILQAPIKNGQIVILPKDAIYSMLFLAESGMIRFDAVVTALAKVDGFSVVRAKLTSAGERVQRREYFRFSCYLPVSFVLIGEDGMQADEESQEGIIRDIGGGGMMILSDFAMPEKSLIRAMLHIDNEYIMVFGHVLHRSRKPGASPAFQYRVRFTAMSNAEQEKIIRFIYNEQRKKLRKV